MSMTRGNRRWRKIALMLTALSMLLAACGGDEPSEEPTGAEAETQEPAAGEETPAEGDTAAEEPQEPVGTLRVGVHPGGAESGFTHMPQHRGLYEEHGVTVEFIELESARQALPALIAGEVDIIEQSPGGLFVAEEQGDVDATIIASTMHGLPYAIYASSEFDSLADLEGASLAVSSPTGLPALVANLMLADAGVDLSTIEYVNGGGNADRYRAVVAGTVDAASSPADFVPQAEQDGLKVLGLSTDVIPNYPRYMVIARNDVLEENEEAVVRYLAALIEGMRYAFDNPDEAAALAAETMGTTPDDPVVTYILDQIREKELVSPNADIMMEKLEYQAEVLRDAGELTQEVDLDNLVDDSYLQQALERVGGPR